jgi:nucleoside-diphosphate-sugar epimerase
MAGETILVTGAAGFTGQHFIAAATAAGHRCVAVCRHPEETVEEADETIACDLTNAAAVLEVVRWARPTRVLHLAAISFVPHGNRSEIYGVNLIGTLNLLDAICSEAPGLKKVLIASSANIYGNAVDLPVSETAPLSPVNHYGVSKYAMEMAAALYRDLPLVITRPFNYTGVGQPRHFLIPKLVAAYREGRRNVELGNLDIARDFSDVRDVVRAYLWLLQKDSTRDVYNICTGKPTRLLEVIDILNALAGYKISVETNPTLMRGEDIAVLYGDASRLESALGIYRRFTLRDTLAWMLDS